MTSYVNERFSSSLTFLFKIHLHRCMRFINSWLLSQYTYRPSSNITYSTRMRWLCNAISVITSLVRNLII